MKKLCLALSLACALASLVRAQTIAQPVAFTPDAHPAVAGHRIYLLPTPPVDANNDGHVDALPATRVKLGADLARNATGATLSLPAGTVGWLVCASFAADGREGFSNAVRVDFSALPGPGALRLAGTGTLTLQLVLAAEPAELAAVEGGAR